MVDDTPSEQRPRVLTLHVFEKVRALDVTLAEFEELLDGGEVIEETLLRPMELKHVVLILDWLRPLHVVVVIDDVRQEEGIVTSATGGGDDAVRALRQRRAPPSLACSGC